MGILVACGAPAIDGADSGKGGGHAGGGGSTGGGAGAAGGGAGGLGGGASSGQGGGGSSGDTLCKPCVSSADCDNGGLCLGDIGHCGADCSQGQACGDGLTCGSMSLGKAPLPLQCQPTPAACGTGRPQGLSCTDTWAGYADGFFASNCRTCHTGGFATPADIDGSVRLVIDQKWMPPGGGNPPLTDAERLRVLTWIACGMPPSSAPTGAAP